MTLFFQRALILTILVSISACGFQLRGSNLEALKDSSVSIQAGGGNDLALELKRQLVFAGVNVTEAAADADYVIQLDGENFERDVLSVSSDTGKVEEYELKMNSRLTVTDADKKRLINDETISARRDYIFDQDSVLGKFDEEQKIRDEMRQQMAASIIRRLRAVTR